MRLFYDNQSIVPIFTALAPCINALLRDAQRCNWSLASNLPLSAKPHSNHRIAAGKSFLKRKCGHVIPHTTSLLLHNVWNLAQIPLPGTHTEPKLLSPTSSPAPPVSSHCALYAPELGMLPPTHTHFSLCGRSLPSA